MAIEPTAGELLTMKTVGDVFTWAGITGDFADAVVQALGAQREDLVRVLAGIEKADVDDTKATLKIGETKLAPAQKGKLEVAWRAARIAAWGRGVGRGNGGEGGAGEETRRR